MSLYIDTSIPNNTVKVFPNGPTPLNLFLNEKKEAFENGNLSEKVQKMKQKIRREKQRNMKRLKMHMGLIIENLG